MGYKARAAKCQTVRLVELHISAWLELLYYKIIVKYKIRLFERSWPAASSGGGLWGGAESRSVWLGFDRRGTGSGA